MGLKREKAGPLVYLSGQLEKGSNGADQTQIRLEEIKNLIHSRMETIVDTQKLRGLHLQLYIAVDFVTNRSYIQEMIYPLKGAFVEKAIRAPGYERKIDSTTFTDLQPIECGWRPIINTNLELERIGEYIATNK
jgi:hypothetical protein